MQNVLHTFLFSSNLKFYMTNFYKATHKTLSFISQRLLDFIIFKIIYLFSIMQVRKVLLY